MGVDFAAELNRVVADVERGIDSCLPAASARPARLHEAMRYSLQAGGKRLRPVLLLSAAKLTGVREDRAIPAAVAIECLHTYSLIHDDLPCMDNDDLRRGRPTAHKAFDEATALLAGDALLTYAFELLATSYGDHPALAAGLVRELAAAAGSRRLVGGQMEDLLAEKNPKATAADLEFIHLNKTAAMIEAALVMGGMVGLESSGSSVGRELARASTASPTPVGRELARAPSPDVLATLRMVGRHLGLAFQIIDDILDATADSATLGKTAGKDAKAGKTTFVKLHGLEASRGFAREHTGAAQHALAALAGDKDFLAALIDSMATRMK